MQLNLYATFLDFKKTLDMTNREGLWTSIHKFDCSKRRNLILHQLPYGMMACVTDNAAVSDAFAVNNEVKHGCVLETSLLSVMFSALLLNAYCDERPGIRIP
ncbi:unnamed protein product [Schistocephalus solidus]|uniref:Uncharacterized protein n=1 Tax=Schistocephalus solidus TaxID=70667 RepID=A0A183SMK9_SCHSO|nr:unnamed protein product [Schistocephalus solidus]